tara:strand:+ start:654 stop:1529 length:876 start_codon:yes stop_codon:yes gene_type:complete
MRSEYASEIRSIFDSDIAAEVMLGGGDVGCSRQIRLADGNTVFVKSYAEKDIAKAEAAGLKSLKATNTVNVPPVLYVSDYLLVLPWIEGHSSSEDALYELGKALAGLHKSPLEFEGFGYSENNFIGASPQENMPMNGENSWAEFFGQKRLWFQGKRLENSPLLSAANRLKILNLLEKLIWKLPELLQTQESWPSLLHGDLWKGNYMIDTDGKAWLIDPAVYQGHREADIAMTTLFGGFSTSFYQGYRSIWPLEDGYRDREPIYQLYHILNHIGFFGEAYLSQALLILKKFV